MDDFKYKKLKLRDSSTGDALLITTFSLAGQYRHHFRCRSPFCKRLHGGGTKATVGRELRSTQRVPHISRRGLRSTWHAPRLLCSSINALDDENGIEVGHTVIGFRNNNHDDQGSVGVGIGIQDLVGQEIRDMRVGCPRTLVLISYYR